MDNVITYKPVGSNYSRVYTFGDNPSVARKKSARDDLKIMRSWDKSGRAYYTSCLFDPARLATFESMPYEEFAEVERAAILTEWKEITKAEYWENLEVLPPINYDDGFFMMSEFWTGSYTRAYRKVGDKYYTRMVDALDRTTWTFNHE